MSKLNIRFRPYVSDSGPAVVPLEILDANLRRVEGVESTLALNQLYEVALPPGQYLVRAFLPSGEMISRQVSLSEDETIPVLLQPEEISPHQDLEWELLLKGTLRKWYRD